MRWALGHKLRFEFRNPPFEALHRGCHVRRVELLRDVLGAVDVPGLDLEQDRLLGCGPVRVGKCSSRAGSSSTVRARPQTLIRRGGIVHEEEEGVRIFREVADRDVLPVAAKVGEAERPLGQHLEEPLAAAMLDVGLPSRWPCQIEGV